jgi:molybdopterin-synthase adenylyltransferase
MIYSTALSSAVHAAATAYLLRADGQEDLCFGLWYPSRGTERTTALLQRLILPQPGERLVHGNASFLPAYFQRALGEAMAAGAGLAFLHSHPAPGWQGMSPDDVRAEDGHAAAAKGATGLPLVGLTLGTDGAWSARFWEKIGPRRYERRWCVSSRVVGERMAVTFHDGLLPPPRHRRELERTVSAWGPAVQARLARLRVGVVGAGSVGQLVAEALARMGVGWIRLIDFDAVEIVNLDRLLHAFPEDARKRRPKVEGLAEALRRSATAARFRVDALEWSVVEESGFRAALDCDVLFSCVDRPWPRSVLNFVAYAHLIPVVDGGIAIQTRPGNTGLRRADWRAHVAAPGRRCLECLGQYDPSLVSAEREGYFDDPAYIAGLPEDHPVKRNENVFAFGMSTAAFEVQQFLSMVVAPLGVSNPGAQRYHFVSGNLETDRAGCEGGCLYPGLTAKGDCSGVVVTGRHAVAERARECRRGRRRSWRHRLWDRLSFLKLGRWWG